MPLRFQNSTAQIFFWIFFLLFVIACAVHVGLCFRKNSNWHRLAMPFCLLFFATALVCIAPQFPLVYISCYLAAAGDLFFPESKNPLCFLCGAALLTGSHILNLAIMAPLFSDPIPPYVYIIVAVIIVLVGIGSYFTRDKEHPALFITANVYSCLLLPGLIFAIKLVANEPLYCEFFLLMGYLFYIASDLVVGRITKFTHTPRRELYMAIPYLIGQACIFLGLILSLTAAHL